MITLIGNAPVSDKYQFRTFVDFTQWLKQQKFYQFDIETDMTESWVNKKLITVQFGSLDGQIQWVIQWSTLSSVERQIIKTELERKDTVKLIHNAMFEGIVLLSHDITIENVYDTMLVEKVLDGGEHLEGYALTDLVEKYLTHCLDKTEQTNFGDDILTENKVVYAAVDVKYLGAIRAMQIPLLQHLDLDWVAALENEVVLAYAEMTYNGFDFDQVKWRENIKLAEPLIQAAEIKLNAWLMQEPFFSKGKQLGYVSDTDSVEIKWSSPAVRTKLLQLVFPDVPGGSLGVVKKYLKGYIAAGNDLEDAKLLEDFLKKDYTLLEQVLIQFKKQELIELGVYIPAGTIRINWNSPDQVLPLFKLINPRLKAANADALAKVNHPLVKDLGAYKDARKLVSTYGEAFIEKYVDVDGKVRPTVNQIVSTGRVSYRNPNLQNIPVEDVGPRYRECFVAPPGWKVVGADMSSQELVIIATLSGDPVWLKSLKDGEDLHSTTSELIYGKKWKEAALDDCAYYHKGHVKCKCPEHEKLRYKVKRINYGLAYGMSEIKLSGDLDITRDEAKDLMDTYFRTFPKIKRLLDYFGRFSVQYGYSRTMAPFFRRRYYNQWHYAYEYIPAHISGMEYNHVLGEVERAGKNMPIQGTAGDQIKTASVLIRWYIHDNGLKDKIKPNLQVHDENVSIALADVAEAWALKKKELMEEAAKISIPSGLLKADTGISERWTK